MTSCQQLCEMWTIKPRLRWGSGAAGQGFAVVGQDSGAQASTSQLETALAGDNFQVGKDKVTNRPTSRRMLASLQ